MNHLLKTILFCTVLTQPLWAFANVSLNISPNRGNGLIEGQYPFYLYVSELVREDGSGEGLHNVMGAQGELSSGLDINIYNQNGELSRLDVPENITQNLLKFFEQGGYAPYNFCDCHCFGALLGGFPYPHGMSGENRFARFPGTKRTQIFSESVLKPGDVVLLGESIDEQTYNTNHTVVYLGNGLYISKLGGSGGLAVTNLEQINKAYRTDLMFLIEAKDASVFTESSSVESEDAPVTSY